jgi:hypothetical protein
VIWVADERNARPGRPRDLRNIPTLGRKGSQGVRTNHMAAILPDLNLQLDSEIRIMYTDKIVFFTIPELGPSTVAMPVCCRRESQRSRGLAAPNHLFGAYDVTLMVY